MRIFITGICGFAGSVLAGELIKNYEVVGIDNLSRRGSEKNVEILKGKGIEVSIGDIRSKDDLRKIPKSDYVIDAAANPSVLAGVNGKVSSRELVENNLVGTLEVLELCKEWNAGFIMLSTSRVYSLKNLVSLNLLKKEKRFVLGENDIEGLTEGGIDEKFSAEPPLSLYGSSKLASEIMALEYGEAFDFPVYINRCGVLAGAGQFGKGDQGVFSFWIHSYLRKKNLKYFGFDGLQVRDCLHPKDLISLLEKQIKNSDKNLPRVINLSGGIKNSASLLELSDWCGKNFGRREIEIDLQKRKFDVPWLILNSNLAKEVWGWEAQIELEDIFQEIALHAEQNPNWLEECS